MIDLSNPTACRVVTDDVSVHWFTSFESGAPCHCGAKAYDPEPFDGDCDAAAVLRESAGGE